MPKYVPPKRKRSKQIQGWFDPDDKDDNEIIQIYDFFSDPEAAGVELTGKDIIAMAMIALATHQNPQLLRPRKSSAKLTAEMFELMFVMKEQIEYLTEQLKNGVVGYVPTEQAQEREEHIEKHYGTHSMSIAGNYSALDFEDED